MSLGVLSVAAAVIGAVAANRRGAGDAFAYVNAAVLGAAAVAAAGACAARARGSARRLPWVLLATVAVLELAARYPVGWNGSGWARVLTTGLHVAAVAAAGTAVLLLRVVTPDRSATRRMLLDTATVAVAVSLVMGSVVFGPDRGTISGPDLVTVGADVVLAVLGLVVLACARYPGGLGLRSLLPVCAGVVGLAAGSAGAVGVRGGGAAAAPVDLLVGAGLLLLAAGAAAGDGEDAVALMPRRERIAVCAAVVPVVLAALAVVGHQLTQRRLPAPVVLGVMALSGLLLARLVVALLDNLALSRTLESQVAARTLEIVTREQWFRSLVQHSSDVVTVVDASGLIRYQSPAAQRLFGHDPAKTVGTSLFGLVRPDDIARLQLVLARARSTSGTSYVVEFPFAHAGGGWRESETVVTSLLDVPDVRGLVLNTRDVSERKRLEERLTQQAYFDALTGLANRSMFQRELADALDNAPHGTVAVLFCDLDGFKAVNDAQGHDAGDALLAVVAERLRRCVRPADLVARFGGDEFAILVRGNDALAAADDVARRVVASLDSPVSLDGRELRVGASIGIAAMAPGAESADILLRNADLAMYRAKAERNEAIAVFEPSMHDALLTRLAVESDLRSALGNGQLVLHYQPTVRLTTGAAVGVEALMRWFHPTRGVVSPYEFIEIAEDNGFIESMGEWALFEACRQGAAWQAAAPPGDVFGIGVNVSARQVSPGLVDLVAAALSESGLPPGALLLEMTESVLLGRTEEAIDVLRTLKRLGVRIAIDDFGTGFSSLSYLARFPVDVLKIDKSFIDAVDVAGERAELARTIIGLGRALSVATIAEGIERPGQAAALRAMGCEFGQGYLFGRPMPAEHINDLLALHPEPAVRSVVGLP